jgi:hypothetical protein
VETRFQAEKKSIDNDKRENNRRSICWFSPGLWDTVGDRLCEKGVVTMSFPVLQAYLKLIYFDLYVARKDFAALYDSVRNYPIAKRAFSPDDVNQICAAVDMACIWYWKEALCLQRSAAAACLLKQHGVPAQMVIGARQMPFKAHAWVEVDGRVVNDKSYTPEIYGVLDRC